MVTMEQEQAVRNLSTSVDIAAKLPHRVLAASYADVYVMDFERLVRGSAVDLLKVLLRSEGADVAVLASFEEIGRETQDWRKDVFFVYSSTEAETYWSFIKRNIAELGHGRLTPEMPAPWWILAARMGACSNLGTWCIYGEKFAEIAVLGFRESPDASLQQRLHSEFGIERLADALKRDALGRPGNEYSKQQRAVLRSAYLP